MHACYHIILARGTLQCLTYHNDLGTIFVGAAWYLSHSSVRIDLAKLRRREGKKEEQGRWVTRVSDRKPLKKKDPKK